MTPSARVAASTVAALIALAAAPAPRAHALPGDPLGIGGTWSYETASNCGPVIGTGRVSFRYRAGRQDYYERGHVYWSHSGQTIRWWGPVRWDAGRRRIVGRIDNSLGDRVRADWRIVGDPPRELRVEWTQTNGCRGTGVARRAGAEATPSP